MLGGYMAGVTVSGVLWAIFQNNAGGAWDNAKKSFEAGVEINGEMTYKGSEAHKAAVTGDTVGDPFKDTSGPSMNILIKLTCLIGLVIAPILGGHTNDSHAEELVVPVEEIITEEAVPVENFNLIEWTGRKVGGAHMGTLVISKSTVKVEEGNVTGQMTIDMNSIACTDIEPGEDNDNLIGHLRATDFFAIDSIPTASFVVTTSIKDEENENYFKITGDLTIRGVSNPIEFPAMVMTKDGKTQIEASFAFDRTAYGIEYGSKSIIGKLAGKFIYDEIELSLNGNF
jgi:polyisoprenoid-binding protein YceI